MVREGTVARLAVHMRVLAFGLHIQNIGMTRLASLVTGELHRTGRNVPDCIAPIVPVLPEAGRHHVVSDDKKDNESENKESRESE